MINNPNDPWQFIFQKAGKLTEPTQHLYGKLGAVGPFSEFGPDLQRFSATAYTPAHELVAQHCKAIPYLVATGEQRIGLVGMDVLREAELETAGHWRRLKVIHANPFEDSAVIEKSSDSDVPVIAFKLDDKLCGIFGFENRCRFDLAVPEKWARPKDWRTIVRGGTIATKYPATTMHFLMQHELTSAILEPLEDVDEFIARRGIDVAIREVPRSVETAHYLNGDEAVCDIVVSGRTLHQNGMVPVRTIIKELPPVLIAHYGVPTTPSTFRGQMRGRLRDLIS